MPFLSSTSHSRLLTCDERLQKIVFGAINEIDFTVICGYRTKDEQDYAFEHGKSKLQWPNSKHNQNPSLAVDLAPVPIDWNNLTRFKELADIVLMVADKQGVKLTWGGDWKRFRDLPHFELADGS